MAEEILDIKICEGDCSCCMNRLYSSIKSHAKMWKEIDEMRFAETPLHRAAEAGNTAVALEILNLMPSLGRKLNNEGQSALHLAIEGAHRDTARALAKSHKQLVRVKGKNGMTPLMQCAARGDEEDRMLLARLLVACPESVTDLNNNHQTVIHVALENRQCKAVCVLVDWLKRRDQIASVLSVKDLKGNTALHAAAQFGCVEGAKSIVGLVKLNRLNSDKKTALNVAIAHSQTEVVQILEKKGAKKRSDIHPAQTTTEYVLSKTTNLEAFSRAYYYLNQQLTLEMRNAILVVATLIVAATYQGVLQPPGGVHPPPSEKNLGNTRHHVHHHMGRRLASYNVCRQHVAGQMVMEKTHYRYFMHSNSFAFALSVMIIIFVAPGTPIFLILHLCLVFMCLSYLIALDAISNSTSISHTIFIIALSAIVGAYIVKLLYYPIKALLVDEDWWLRGLSVKFANYSSSACRVFTVPAMKIAYNIKKQHQVLSLE